MDQPLHAPALLLFAVLPVTSVALPVVAVRRKPFAALTATVQLADVVQQLIIFVSTLAAMHQQEVIIPCATTKRK